jgi:hypothetical protein
MAISGEFAISTWPRSAVTKQDPTFARLLMVTVIDFNSNLRVSFASKQRWRGFMGGKEIAVKKCVTQLSEEAREQLLEFIRLGKRSAQGMVPSVRFI